MIDLFKRRSRNEQLISGGSICIWGPIGSPGKSTFALNLACELALSGRRVLLIDLDTYSASIGTMLGINDPPPGLAAAIRLAGQGRLDADQFARVSVEHSVGKGTLSVLTGLGSDSRWPEVTPQKTRELVEAALESYEYVVLDVASPLETGLKHVGGIVERNVATRTALEISSLTVALFNADQLGIKRFCDAFELLSGIVGEPILVANRLRQSALGGGAKRQIEEVIGELCKTEINWFIPEDRNSCDRAVLEMVPLAILKRSSAARQVIAQFARANFSIVEGHKLPRASKLG